MNPVNYTSEELEILEYMETNPKSVENIDAEIEKITSIVKESVKTRKQVNFRLNENDLDKLKSRALIDGIPYQTLLNSIVHKFLNGTLVYKESSA